MEVTYDELGPDHSSTCPLYPVAHEHAFGIRWKRSLISQIVVENGRWWTISPTLPWNSFEAFPMYPFFARKHFLFVFFGGGYCPCGTVCVFLYIYILCTHTWSLEVYNIHCAYTNKDRYMIWKNIYIYYITYWRVALLNIVFFMLRASKKCFCIFAPCHFLENVVFFILAEFQNNFFNQLRRLFFTSFAGCFSPASQVDDIGRVGFRSRR